MDIIFNECYDSCNNIYSLYKVLDRFGDSWIIEGDVYMQENCFTTGIQQSTYFAKWHEHYENEWGLETDENGTLVNINIGEGCGCVMSGISYWTETTAELIKERISTLIGNSDYTRLFWDNAVMDVLPYMNVRVMRTDLYEIDTITDLMFCEDNMRKYE